MYDVIVIGGGIVGTSVAYHLVSEGVGTLLLDRRDEGRATDAGAGIVASALYSGDSDAWFDFAIQAFDYYPLLIEALRTDQADETGYARCGALKVAASEDELKPFECARQIIRQRQRQGGPPRLDEYDELSPGDAKSLFPPLTEVHGALYYRGAIRIDGRLIEQAMRRAAQRRGLQVQRTGVDRLVIDNNRFTGVEAANQKYEAPFVVIAGGAWSHEFGKSLGIQIPVQPQRGQIIYLDMHDAETSSWPSVSAFRDHYLLPWPDHRIVVGATRERAGFRTETTAAGIHQVLEEALRVAPGLASAAIREVRVGLRPLTVDGLPVLTVQGVYVATGHGPSGLSQGPYSGKVVADLIVEKEIRADLTSLGVHRFT